MFHTFRGSPGSSRGKLLRVLLATGNSNSPPTATSPSITNQLRERKRGEHQHWYTQEDPNPIKSTINKYDVQDLLNHCARYNQLSKNIHLLKSSPALPLAAAAALAAAVRSTTLPCSWPPPQHTMPSRQPLQKFKLPRVYCATRTPRVNMRRN
jgi:hypothetical protein